MCYVVFVGGSVSIFSKTTSIQLKLYRQNSCQGPKRSSQLWRLQVERKKVFVDHNSHKEVPYKTQACGTQGESPTEIQAKVVPIVNLDFNSLPKCVAEENPSKPVRKKSVKKNGDGSVITTRKKCVRSSINLMRICRWFMMIWTSWFRHGIARWCRFLLN